MKYLKRERNKSSFSTKSAHDYDLRVSKLVSTLETACTAFHKYNAVKRAFKHRNISNGRETMLIYRQNRLMTAICVCLGILRRWKTRVPRFCMHNTVKGAFNRRNIWNGRETTLYFRQNRQMITICVYMRLFRRWKPRALHSTSIMQWKERINVEIFQTGEKQRLIFVKIGKCLRFACVWACFDAEKRILQVCRREANV